MNDRWPALPRRVPAKYQLARKTAFRWQFCWQWVIFKLIQKHKSLLFMML